MVAGKPILITGIPRSGTTWVGRMIAQTPLVRYIHEPFNITGRSCACGVKFDYWFYYISRENEYQFLEHLEHVINASVNRYSLLNLAREVWTTGRVQPVRSFVKSFRGHRPLIKDPLALFSAGWMASVFDMAVIVVIRHPAAVVASYKELNWSHPFSHFLDQSLLMKDHLYPFEEEIRDFASNQHDIIDQASLLWKLIYHLVVKLQKSQENWAFVRHEDLARNPVDGFQTIFERLDLEFSERVSQTLQAHSESTNPANFSNPYSIRRNSEQIIWNWKERLTSSEIERIRTRVEEISGLFYSNEDW